MWDRYVAVKRVMDGQGKAVLGLVDRIEVGLTNIQLR